MPVITNYDSLMDAINSLSNRDGSKVVSNLEAVMEEVGSKIVSEMKDTLESHGHNDTGKLSDSIGYEVTHQGDKIVLCVYITAEGENGAWYAEFIEHGSGVYGQNGRKGGWYYIYKGNKVTANDEIWAKNNPDLFNQYGGYLRWTSGMKSDPFIEPSVSRVLNEFADMINTNVFKYVNTVRYGK